MASLPPYDPQETPRTAEVQRRWLAWRCAPAGIQREVAWMRLQAEVQRAAHEAQDAQREYARVA